MKDNSLKIQELIQELNSLYACKIINELKWENLYFGRNVHPESKIPYLTAYLSIKQVQYDQNNIFKSKSIRLKTHLGREDTFDPNNERIKLNIITSFKKKGGEMFGCN